MNRKQIRILIADDHKLMRMGLVSLFDMLPDMTVVGEAEDGEEALAAARELKPDVVILDLMMPKLSGADATQALLAENPQLGIIVLSSLDNSADMARAIAFGARGAQAKEAPTEDLVAAVRAVAAGRTTIAPEIQHFVDNEPLPPPLTDRQLAILRSVTRGLSNADIAVEFGISPVSVKKHLTVIFAKLGAATRAEATAIALRKHVLNVRP